MNDNDFLKSSPNYLAPAPIVEYPPPVPKIDSRSKALDDFEQVRTNLIEIIETGQESLATLAQVADQAQNDKFYAAYASLLKTVSDANMKLLEIQEKIRQIKNEDRGVPKTINNTLVMTSSDLLKMIKDGQKDINSTKEIIDVDTERLGLASSNSRSS